jgi:ribosomal protein L37AE/L43A
MVAAVAKNLGKMPCPHCSEPVAVKQTASGILKWDCQDADCEATGFARAHTAAAAKILAALGTKPAPPKAPTPEPEPVPPKAPAPAPKPARVPFSLGGL